MHLFIPVALSLGGVGYYCNSTLFLLLLLVLWTSVDLGGLLLLSVLATHREAFFSPFFRCTKLTIKGAIFPTLCGRGRRHYTACTVDVRFRVVAIHRRVQLLQHSSVWLIDRPSRSGTSE